MKSCATLALFLVLPVVFACSSNNNNDASGGSGGGGAEGGVSGEAGRGQGGSSTGTGGSSGSGSGGANSGGSSVAGSGGSVGKGGNGGMTAGGAGGSAGMLGAGGIAGAPGGMAGSAGSSPPVGQGNPKFGGAVFLAVGGGKTATSTDGKVWTAYPDGMTPNNLEILGSCIGNDVVVAMNHMSNGGVKQGVWTSDNGHNFVRTFPATDTDGLPGEDCAFGKGLFSAGNRYSMDAGKNWQNATSDGGVGNRGIAFGNGVFVGAGDNNLDWSADGKTWSKGTVVGGGSVTGMSYVVFAGTKFLAVPFNNTNPSYESTDGKAWTKTKSQLPTQSQSYNVSAAVKKIFVVTSMGIYWLPDTSAPGADMWTKSLSSFSEGAIGGNDAIAVSAKHWSLDGATWMSSTTPIPNNYNISRILKLN